MSDLPRTYPLPRPDDDDRFTFGLTVRVGEILEAAGYPPLKSGADFIELRQALFHFLYAPIVSECSRTDMHLSPEGCSEVGGNAVTPTWCPYCRARIAEPQEFGEDGEILLPCDNCKRECVVDLMNDVDGSGALPPEKK